MQGKYNFWRGSGVLHSRPGRSITSWVFLCETNGLLWLISIFGNSTDMFLFSTYLIHIWCKLYTLSCRLFFWRQYAMMNGLLKETYGLKFNKALTTLKSMSAYWNEPVLIWVGISEVINFMFLFRPDYEAGYQDFKMRLDNYEKVVFWTSSGFNNCSPDIHISKLEFIISR